MKYPIPVYYAIYFGLIQKKKLVAGLVIFIIYFVKITKEEYLIYLVLI